MTVGRNSATHLGVRAMIAIYALATAVAAQNWPVVGPFVGEQELTPDFFGTFMGLGDVDADGDPDLLGLGPTYALLNDGHGRFLQPPTLWAGQPPTFLTAVSSIAVADLNLDGRSDFVASSLSGTSIFLALTTGAFVQVPTPANFRATVVGDVNGDGYPDFVAGRMAVPVGLNPPLPLPTEVWLNLGGVALSFAGTLGLPAFGSAAAMFLDVDADGDQDFVQSDASVAFNAGGAFGPLVAPTGTAGVVGGALLRSRLNADAYPDLIVGGSAFFSGGPGGFTFVASSFSALGRGPIGASVDLDGDGLDEVVFDVAGGIGWAGSGIAAPAVLQGSIAGAAGELYESDVDLDGDDDLVTLSGNYAPASSVLPPASQYRVYFNDGAGALSTAPSRLVRRPLLGGPVLDDFDGDGLAEIAAVEDVAGSARVLLADNDGLGRFTWRGSVVPLGTSPGAVAMRMISADLDGDGDRDLATLELYPFFGTSSINFVRAMLNDGAGGFTGLWAVMLPAGGVDVDFVAADFDGDGDDDLAVVETSSGTVWRLSLAAGVLGPPSAISTVGTPRGVVAGDLDHDGDVDLVVAGASSRLLLNDGAGNFTADPGFPAVGAWIPTLVDLSGDGVVDVYLDAALYQQSTLGIWALLGQVPTGVAAPYPPYEVRSFDFDLDGDIDTITATGHATTNLGGGAVGSFALPVGAAPRFQLADIDADGDLDILTSYKNLPGYGPSGGPYDLLVNRSRRLVVSAPLRPGRPTHVGLNGLPNGAWLLFAAGAINPLPAPPYGVVFLDLGSVLQVGAGVFDASGAADAAGFLPASFSALVGFELDLQAVVDTPSGPRLTNAERAFILGF